VVSPAASRGVACAAHVFAAHVRADPALVWTALTDPGPHCRVPLRPGGALDLGTEFRLAGRIEARLRVTRAPPIP
jgi:hypothetical protein